MGKTAIQWTEQTWNPIVGCSIVSPGCTNCYAMKEAWRFGFNPQLKRYHGLTKQVNGKPVWTGKLALAPEATLLAPLKRKKPTMYFVNSMGDLFHEDCPDEWIDRVFAVMALSPQHTFQVLTKRPARMREYMTRGGPTLQTISEIPQVGRGVMTANTDWPLPNVWLGVSAERQQEADERIPLLLQTPAAVRFVSAEPLLGHIDLHALNLATETPSNALRGVRRVPHETEELTEPTAKLDWVIVGGESGPDARPMHPDWARGLRDQCAAAGVAFFFKQWGEWAPNIGAVDGWTINDNPEISKFAHREWEDGRWSEEFWPMWCDFSDGNYDETQCVSRIGKKAAGRLLDGVEHNSMPSRGEVCA